MEIQTLRFFLHIAREGNMTRAAELLNISQPALTKRMHALEEELGKKLFLRRSFSLELTEEGRLLRKRALDIVSMADKISAEFASMDDVVGGHLYFGCAESYQIRHLAVALRNFKTRYPALQYHITSGDTEQVTEKLDKGLLDFAILVEEPDRSRYGVLEMPEADTWGLVVPKSSELAEKERIVFEDLRTIPLFCSEQSWRADISPWCGGRMEELHLEGSFRLAYNASIFVREGLGCLLTFERLVDTSEASGLAFVPLHPPLVSHMYFIWRSNQAFTPLAQRFLDEVRTAWAEG